MTINGIMKLTRPNTEYRENSLILVTERENGEETKCVIDESKEPINILLDGSILKFPLERIKGVIKVDSKQRVITDITNGLFRVANLANLLAKYLMSTKVEDVEVLELESEIEVLVKEVKEIENTTDNFVGVAIDAF